MCAVFTYDQMTPGAQWTALWYREGELVHYETIPWNGETGGFGFTEWEAPASEWLPGTYQVQIFVGLEWKVGRTIHPPGRRADRHPHCYSFLNTYTLADS